MLYDEALKRYRDYKNTVEYAEEKGIKKGIEQGIEIGKIEGREQGIEIGKAEGLAQGKLEMALVMKRKGIPLEVIAECSGLSLEDIERL